MKSSQEKLSFTLVGGHVIECFDNTLYGFLAVMLAPVYFPTTAPSLSLLASYGAFAAGFLSRPLGALVFGFIGDKYGRKIPLIWTMVFVGIPTLLIGLTPSYETIGIFAPILLIICRLVQGFFWGGEFTGVNLFVYENMHKSKHGTHTGILIAVGVMGAVLASGMAAFFAMTIMPEWFWRIPFIIGGICTFIIFILRRRLHETRDFEDVLNHKRQLSFPLGTLITQYKGILIASCLIAGLTVMPLYGATIFGNGLFKKIGYSNAECLVLNSLAMFIDAILIIAFGRMADKIGFYKQMMLGCIMIVAASVPSFYLINGANVSIIHVFLFVFILTSVGAIINGCAMPYIASLYPTNCRYSAVALSVTLGHALLGGTMPLVSSFLTETFHSALMPGIWLSLVSISVCLLLWLIDSRAKKVTQLHYSYHSL